MLRVPVSLGDAYLFSELLGQSYYVASQGRYHVGSQGRYYVASLGPD